MYGVPRCGSPPKLMRLKEHGSRLGRDRDGLHLNVVWDVRWSDQRDLAALAADHEPYGAAKRNDSVLQDLLQL